MLSKEKGIIFFLGTTFSLAAWLSLAGPLESKYSYTPEFLPGDTSKKNNKRPQYTPEDRYGDPYSNPGSKSPFILPMPKNVQENIILDDSLKTYTIEEKAGGVDVRPPSVMTYQEYKKFKNREMLKNNWKNASGTDTSVQNNDVKSLIPKIKFANKEGPFGSPYAEIRPTGLVTLDFGAMWQKVANPNIAVRQQKQGQFLFDQTITMNVVGKIGDKLKLTTNWDTKAAFEFQNNLKLEFTGYEEDIIQKIEAGNVSLPLNSTLITGAQNLFGLKTKLQFGRLSTTVVLSTQRGKVEEIKIQGGAQSKNFDIKADNYDEYRHFFLSQFFRDNYENSLKTLPNVLSGVRVTRVQAFITNRINVTDKNKNIVAYTDLGEPDSSDMFRKGRFVKPGIPQAPKGVANFPADNNSNTLYSQISGLNVTDDLASELAAMNLVRGSDFEIVNQARELKENVDFYFNQDLGFITLTTPLRPDEVLGVAFQYSYQGQAHTVGQLREEAQVLKDSQSVILKLIKPQTIKTRLPTWDLMMKNVYQLGGSQITRDNFQLRVIYKDDQTGADLPNLQQGVNTAGVPLLRLTRLDQLNPNNDPFPDGNFDFVEGVTMDSKNGRVFFPVLEPFGANLEQYFLPTEVLLERKYVFFELYDSTKSDAQQVASKNKYYLRGKFQAGTSDEIILPGINIAPGSVTVLAGSTPLIEGTDYEINPTTGRLKIKNQGVMASNKEITIRFEKQDFINFRRKSFIGSRFDYKINKDFIIGGTMLHQTESPNISRVNIGDEPSSNTIIGLDGNFKAESRFLTKMIDKLPIIQTKAVSSINFTGEGAALIPGYPKLLNKSGNEGGTSYLDDFEGSETPYDLTRVPVKWRVGATPLRFPEANSFGLDYTFGRAKLAWYNIDNVFFNTSNPNYPPDFKNNLVALDYVKNNNVRQVLPTEIFPGKFQQQINLPETLLDLAYYPAERGAYNYNPNFNPAFAKQHWAAMTREIKNDIDFDNANIQYIEFWMMDPFSEKVPLTLNPSGWQQATGGDLYFNLGSVSEDIMKDGKQAFENGLPVNDADLTLVETNEWGKVTKKTFLTGAFDNADNSRTKQDIGLDGLNNNDEKLHPDYPAAVKALDDPSSDDFVYYLGDNQSGKGILERYKNYNGLENNSPLNSGGTFNPSNSTLPDNEDLNNDNTVSQLEEYYEYRVKIDPSNLQVGRNHIVDKVAATDLTTKKTVNWYQFRIPIREPDSTIGQINGFKSIRFMRMYLTNFQDPVVLRMAQFQLVANQWRVYQINNINPGGGSSDIEPTGATLVVSTVNIEENGQGTPQKSRYVLPPGFKRDQDVISQTYRQLNEQSLQLCIDDLEDGKAKGAYKNVTYNLINYDRIRMFLHAESKDPTTHSNDVSAFLRIGTDNTANYYEIEVPLHLTPLGSVSDNEIWPNDNLIDIAITELTDTKGERNRLKAGNIFPFTRTLGDGKRITVVGNPDLTAVLTLMLGVRNPQNPNDGKKPVTVCIWADELRVTGFNSQNGYATTARMNLKLADLANVNISGKYSTVGWGSLDQKVSQRSRVNAGEWGISSNIALDKFIPEKAGIKLPMFVSLDQRLISPKYDPLDPDMLMKVSLANITNPNERAQYKSFVVDKTTRKSINFTNVQKVRTKKDAKPHIYDVENLAFTAAFSHEKRTNVNLADSTGKYYKGEILYAFNANPKNYEPFKKVKWLKSPYLKLIKDLNFTPLPSTLSFRGSLDRRLTKIQYYEGNPLGGLIQNPFFQKQFTFSRNYGLNWNFTKSITLDYKANAYAIIDEPNRNPDIDKKEYNDSLLSNVLRLGRLKNFEQTVGATYKLPLDKIPLVNWINADTKYTAGSMWSSGALGIRDTLGNLLQNNQVAGLTGKVNLEKLYNKVKFLEKINNPTPPPKPTQKDTSKTLPKKQFKGLKSVARGFMSVKSVNFTYNITRSTALPGYMPIPKFMGFSQDANGNTFDMAPFIFGSQDPNIRLTAAQNGWLGTSRSQNSPFTQVRSIDFSANTQLEPVKDFKITLNVIKKKSTNYQEIFKHDTTANAGINDFISLSPSRGGSVSVSIISIRTAFRGATPGSKDPNSSINFSEFEAYTNIIKSRLPNSNLFDTTSQNVLIPAFLAAYTKKDPNKISTNSLYPTIPLPNWKIDFTGLTRIKAIKKIFPSLTVSHAYTSTYTIGNYISNQRYGIDTINPFTDINTNPIPGNGILNQSGFAVPVYVVDQVNITEAFNPLIGVNFRTNKKITGNFSIRRTRILTLNLTNAQVQEELRNDVTVGFGMIRSGFQPFKKLPPLKNELNAKVDVTVGDRKLVQRKFDQTATITSGNLNVQIRPNITYAINQRLNLMIYFERTINAPKISSSYKSSMTKFGVQLRFTLS